VIESIHLFSFHVDGVCLARARVCVRFFVRTTRRGSSLKRMQCCARCVALRLFYKPWNGQHFYDATVYTNPRMSQKNSIPWQATSPGLNFFFHIFLLHYSFTRIKNKNTIAHTTHLKRTLLCLVFVSCFCTTVLVHAFYRRLVVLLVVSI